jgi:hypothetical protein
MIGERIGLWQREGRAIPVSGRLAGCSRPQRGETLDPDLVRLLEVLDASRGLRELPGWPASWPDLTDTRRSASTRFEEGLKRTRVPLRAIVSPFERMVRLAQAAGNVVLRIEAPRSSSTSTCSRRSATRSSISSATRLTTHRAARPARGRGQATTGTIVLSAEQIGPELHLVMRDDGAGLTSAHPAVRWSRLGGAEGWAPPSSSSWRSSRA